MEDKLELGKISENGINEKKIEYKSSNINGVKRGETKNQDDELNDDIYLEERIDVPEPDGRWFSWRKLWMFTGPGWLSK